MGLDVYLYKFEKPPQRQEEDDDYEGGEQIEVNSKVYPDHMFKVGYLRSSYNGGGIERLIGDALGMRPLAYIFGRGERDDRYEFRPDWGAALKRAREMAATWAEHLKVSGNCTVQGYSFNSFIPMDKLVGSEQEAMAAYLEQKAREDEKPDRKDKEESSWYSNGKGDFFFGARHLRVRAMFAGYRKGFMGTLMGLPDHREPCFYAIVEGEPDDKPNWYSQALEITVEMCEWVLGQADPSMFWLHWSG